MTLQGNERMGEVLLLAFMLSACGGGTTAAETQDARLSEWEGKVHEVIPDETRRAAVLRGTEEFREIAVASTEQATAYSERFRALNANYDTPREDFVSLIDDDVAARASLRERLYTIREMMIENTTEEEWAALGDARHRMVEASVASALEAAAPGTEAAVAPEDAP